MSVLEKGQLKERVKSGEVSAKEAHRALTLLKQRGEVVSDAMLR